MMAKFLSKHFTFIELIIKLLTSKGFLLLTKFNFYKIRCQDCSKFELFYKLFGRNNLLEKDKKVGGYKMRECKRLQMFTFSSGRIPMMNFGL